MPSFSRRFARWRSTVLRLITRCSAMASLVYPSAISLTTWSSRGVRRSWGPASPLPGCSRYSRTSAVTALVREYLEQPGRGEAGPQDLLTPRELQVVKLIAEGYTSDAIAEHLVISRKTVDRHRANLLEKLGMRSVAEVTRYAIRRGLLEP